MLIVSTLKGNGDYYERGNRRLDWGGGAVAGLVLSFAATSRDA
jgi:hypothetical protein